MTTRIATAALAALLLLTGCKGAKPLPKTYLVTGKVVRADGSPVAGGLVHFKPQGNADVTTSGPIGADGSFSLSTFIDGQKVPGATEGPHTVTVLPSQGQDQGAAGSQVAQPVELRDTFTVKADGENHFTIMLPKGR
jgi:hypothetical protein